MKLLLLCLGLTLVCAHHEGNHEVVTSNFDMSKISGEWYSILIAANHKEMIEENGSLRAYMKSIQALDNSSLVMTYYEVDNGECTELFVIADETEEKGVYIAPYQGLDVLFIIESDYNDYVVVYDSIFHNGGETQMMELYARKPYVSQTLKKRFRKLCQENGIAKENIVDLTKAGRCLNARLSEKA